MEMDPITSYSDTHHTLLLIDLDPLLHHHHRDHYTKSILSAAKTLLSFPSTSSALFAFKFFFSSASPYKLDPFLPDSNPALTFNLPSPTLHLLSQTLSSLPHFPPLPTNHLPSASHLSASINYFIGHYTWDRQNNAAPLVPPNLLLVLSPLPEPKSLSAFFQNHQSSSFPDATSFCQSFSRSFGTVTRASASFGIHCSWIAVNNHNHNSDEVAKIRRLFQTGAAKLGWGFCSIDSILLGSALVPFGLIYPKIGIPWFCIRSCSSSSKAQVQLSLRIKDVNGNPIEYNCCDLELVDFKVVSARDERVQLSPNLQAGGGCQWRGRLWSLCSDGAAKLQVKVVQRCDAFVNLRGCLYDSVLVREVFRESKKESKGSSDEFFADRVLEMVAAEFGCRRQRKSVPIWEILLSFLYKQGFWALVTVTNDKGGSCVGVLRPFTVSSALLSVLGDPHVACDFGEANLGQYVRKGEAEIYESDRKLNKSKDLLDSQDKKSDAGITGLQEKKMMDLSALRNLTWSSYCDLVYDRFETDLHEVYYAVECSKSKRLKFLKCWMKQVKKSGSSDLTLSEKPKPTQMIAEESQDTNSTLPELTQNGDQPISLSASAGINTEVSRIQDDAALDFRSETSEEYFSSLSNKIHQGIESEVIDLGALAARLVNSSIYWLSQKVDKETMDQSHSPLKDDNASGSKVASELIKLLLREPKEIAAEHKSRSSFTQASDSGPTTTITDHLGREYELQILFRMEILQSEVGNGVEDSSKQKFVKQICLLLEKIQCHMEAGFVGDWTLENYVATIIKNRYSHTLEDVVHKIYNKMDLLPLADEDDGLINLFNSEDSNKSSNLKVYRDEMGENDIRNEPVSAENELFQLQKDWGIQGMVEKDRDKKLIEDKERRERACRSRLQSLWAPKQNGVKLKTDHLQKLPKRKERPRASYDTVCETPMTRNKRSSQCTRDWEYDSRLADGSPSCGSVSKALFQDDL
ncbi:uncharacterized protein LOC130747956 [Lotus japonicus]|uniref:uncharacterized protein LOC130747956 n=1 Tax=Lotus japonicus TaxID=34305 RepID=UPI002587C8D2|nr:uncharacterized protein LOC130747956 [Lotus japonicus]